MNEMRKKIKIEQELLPCPICGWEAEVVMFIGEYEGNTTYNQYAIGCSNDTWSGRDANCYRPTTTECGPCIEDGTPRQHGRSSDEEAIENIVRLWNKRSGE